MKYINDESIIDDIQSRYKNTAKKRRDNLHILCTGHLLLVFDLLLHLKKLYIELIKEFRRICSVPPCYDEGLNPWPYWPCDLKASYLTNRPLAWWCRISLHNQDFNEDFNFKLTWRFVFIDIQVWYGNSQHPAEVSQFSVIQYWNESFQIIWNEQVTK